MSTPLTPYDVAAYEHFCSDLVAAGFEPIVGTDRRRWRGPLRSSLSPLTQATTMELDFRDGWPYKYAHVTVGGIASEHIGHEIICLWAEDDPAQRRGITLAGLWERLDGWATAASTGFAAEDQALDAYMGFEAERLGFAELDLPAFLVNASNGHIAEAHGQVEGSALLIASDQDQHHPLTGQVYLRTGLDRPPRTMQELRASLTHRQRASLDRLLAQRNDVDATEASGGLDFLVFCWPRHSTHDALVISFAGAGADVRPLMRPPSPTDVDSRLRRAGPDAQGLSTARVLIAGIGAIGGYVATTLAASGVGRLSLHDSDDLKTVNLVRYAGDGYGAGWSKCALARSRINNIAPWCAVDIDVDLPLDPHQLADAIRGVDLVVDTTGIAYVTAALAHVCGAQGVPILSAALYHGGALLRVRRQAAGDIPLLGRAADDGYSALPPDDPTDDKAQGFLELGCTALVHNAPPASVLHAAAHTAAVVVDYLTGQRNHPDEEIHVLRPLASAPFDRLGLVPRAAAVSGHPAEAPQ